MPAPIIAITTGLPPKGQPGAQVNATYLAALQEAGGVPLLLPPQLSAASLVELLVRVAGVVLTGGGDIDPALYGEAPHPATAGISGDRDQVELAVIRFALGQGLPVLAICRGMQMVNVALGGSLIQDIPTGFDTDVAHFVAEPRDGAAHGVRIEAGSRLAGLIGAETAGVNSRHHQAVGDVGQGLVPVAWAPGGLVEGLEMPGRWVVGVQWHPEDMTRTSPAARALFEGLVAEASHR